MTAGEYNRGLVLKWGAATDIGPVRSENEDSWLAAPPFFAVADGMGGHLGGARASMTAVQTLREYLSEERLGDRAADLVDLSEAVEEAGDRVSALAGAADAQNAPGTTLTGVLALDTDEGPYWLSLNIGDSRVYVVGNGRISPITHDHSAVQEARDMAEELGTPQIIPPSNVVTKALGGGLTGSVSADYTLMPLCEGDYAVVCSDGIHGVLTDAQMCSIVTAGRGPQGVADHLVSAALSAGTRDNATAVVVYAASASRLTSDPHAMTRVIQPVRPASTRTTRRTPLRKGSN